MTEHPIVDAIMSFLSKPEITARGLIQAVQPLFEVYILEELNSTSLDDGIKDDGFFRIALDLWSDDQSSATTICESFGPKSLSMLPDANEDDPTRFSAEMRTNRASAKARRIVLSFDYWETEERANAFINTAVEWADSNLGNAQDEPFDHAVQRRSVINASCKSAQFPGQ